jgi:hypothetical protein
MTDILKLVGAGNEPSMPSGEYFRPFKTGLVQDSNPGLPDGLFSNQKSQFG